MTRTSVYEPEIARPAATAAALDPTYLEVLRRGLRYNRNDTQNPLGPRYGMHPGELADLLKSEYEDSGEQGPLLSAYARIATAGRPPEDAMEVIEAERPTAQQGQLIDFNDRDHMNRPGPMHSKNPFYAPGFPSLQSMGMKTLIEAPTEDNVLAIKRVFDALNDKGYRLRYPWDQVPRTAPAY